MSSDIEIQKLVLKKAGWVLYYHSWLANGRIKKTEIDHAEELSDHAQDLLGDAIACLGLDPGKWSEGEVTSVVLKYEGEDRQFGVTWAIARLVRNEDGTSDRQTVTTHYFEPGRLSRSGALYHRVNNLIKECVEFVENQPVQGNLLATRGKEDSKIEDWAQQAGRQMGKIKEHLGA